MKWDWVWGMIAIIPAMFLSGYALAWIGVPPGGHWIGLTLMFVLTVAFCTGAMWLKNRHSIRKIRRAGGEIALMIRPLDAMVYTARIFPVYLGANILWSGLIEKSLYMPELLTVSAVIAFVNALQYTAYTPPMKWT